MRARIIKPGFYANEQLAECSVLARLIFPGLWMLADRRGRLEDRPKRIKGTLLPYDDGDVDALLNELQRAGMLVRYTVGEQRLIQITAFERHQKCHPREVDSELHPVPDHTEGVKSPCSDEQKQHLGTAEAQPRHNLGTAEATPRTPVLEAEAEAVERVLPLPEASRETGGAGGDAAPRKRAARLSDDWRLPSEWAAWAVRERPAMTPTRIGAIADEFADHWRGKGEPRLDWFATWRNWIRREHDPPTARHNGKATADRRAAFMAANFGANDGTGDGRERDITADSERIA